LDPLSPFVSLTSYIEHAVEAIEEMIALVGVPLAMSIIHHVAITIPRARE
jgi:uncharacterized membrane protein YccF (DUF307 family)